MITLELAKQYLSVRSREKLQIDKRPNKKMLAQGEKRRTEGWPLNV